MVREVAVTPGGPTERGGENLAGPGLVFDRLRRALEVRARDYGGVLAVTVIDLEGGLRLDVNGDVTLGCGSCIKIPILMTLMRRHAAGEIDLDAFYPVTDANRAGGAGILPYLRPDLPLTGRDLATLMINLSDNTATNACIDLAGMENVQALIASMSPRAALRRKMQDWSAAAAGIENVATSAAMAEWLRRLWTGEFGSREVSDACLRVLRYPKDGLLNRALGSGAAIANKPGGLNGGKSDVGVVWQRRRPYVVSIMTAFVFQRNGTEEVVEVARLVHEHMAILDKYKPMGVPHVEHFVREGRAPGSALEER
jgi:beta-lactamase class A